MQSVPIWIYFVGGGGRGWRGVVDWLLSPSLCPAVRLESATKSPSDIWRKEQSGGRDSLGPPFTDARFNLEPRRLFYSTPGGMCRGYAKKQPLTLSKRKTSYLLPNCACVCVRVCLWAVTKVISQKAAR